MVCVYLCVSVALAKDVNPLLTVYVATVPSVQPSLFKQVHPREGVPVKTMECAPGVSDAVFAVL